MHLKDEKVTWKIGQTDSYLPLALIRLIHTKRNRSRKAIWLKVLTLLPMMIFIKAAVKAKEKFRISVRFLLGV